MNSCVGNAKTECKKKLTTNPFGDIINVGAIGLGRQCLSVSKGFAKINNVRIVACTDVYQDKCTRYVKTIGDIYAKKGIESNIQV